jgi:hypothetical protein
MISSLFILNPMTKSAKAILFALFNPYPNMSY